jgi:DUF4097 and DUF4098 domain-containing protein YvlB
VAAGILVAVFAVAALVRSLQPSSAVGERETTTTTRHSGSITAVVVDNDSGDIEIAPGPTKVVRTERWTLSRQTVTETVRDGVLKIKARCPQPVVSVNNCSTDFRITAPRAARLTLSVAAGDVQARGFGGDQELASSAGSVSALQASARRVSVRSSAGNVIAELLSAPDDVTAHTSSGDVVVTVPAGRYAVTAHTTSGHSEVGVQQDPTSAHRIDATTSSGDITIRPR